MSQILKTSIGILIAGVTFVGVIILIYNITIEKDGVKYKGFTNIIGANANIENNSLVIDNTVFKSYMSSSRPEIFFDNTGLQKIVSNEDYTILKYFKVKFNDQEEFANVDNLDLIDLNIKDISKEDGNSVLYLYDYENKLINFSDTGIYTFTFYLLHNQKESIVKVKVPVD